MKQSQKTALKLVVLLCLLLVTLIPLMMIRAIVRERENRQVTAQEEVIALHGGRQVLVGPVLVVPVTVTVVNERGVAREETREIAIPPAELDVQLTLDPELLNRGIYEIPVYQATTALTARFQIDPDIHLPVDLAGEGAVRIDWGQGKIVLGIEGIRGLRTQPTATIEGLPAEVHSSGRQVGYSRAGVSVPLPQAAPGGSYEVAIGLALQGGGSLHLVPTAMVTRASMESPWPSPSFSGEVLPAFRSVTDDGFSADWELTGLGTGMPEIWRWSGVEEAWLHGRTIGVELLQPVGQYQRTERSVKYGVLFVLLPFVALFLLEIFTSARIHPIQYLLVAAAKTLFYLLLLSLSEHIGFGAAYWGAAGATVILVTAYLTGVVAKRWQAYLLGGMIASEYLFLFSALQSEDYALLIGSTGLFALLTVVMIATRRINWYQGEPESPQS
jgi:inner membrane protein